MNLQIHYHNCTSRQRRLDNGNPPKTFKFSTKFSRTMFSNCVTNPCGSCSIYIVTKTFHYVSAIFESNVTKEECEGLVSPFLHHNFRCIITYAELFDHIQISHHSRDDRSSISCNYYSIYWEIPKTFIHGPICVVCTSYTM